MPAVQCNTVQYSAVQYSTEQCRTVTPVILETNTCDRTEHSYIGGRHNHSDEGGGRGRGNTAVKKVVFRLGKTVLGQANFLSDTEEDVGEEERLVMDFSDEEEIVT